METKQKCERWYGTVHTFGKWSETNRAEIKESPNFGPNKGNWHVVGFAVIQERVCEVCGFKDIKRTEITTN